MNEEEEVQPVFQMNVQDTSPAEPDPLEDVDKSIGTFPPRTSLTSLINCYSRVSRSITLLLRRATCRGSM